MAFPLLLGKLVNATTSDSFWSAPLTDLTNIDSIAKLLMLVFAAQAAFGFVRIYLFGLVSENALANLRQDTYAHLVRLPMLFFAQRRVGELNSRISADVALLQEGMTTSLAELLRQVVTIGLGITLLTFVSVKLTLTMLATLPVVASIAVFFGNYIRKLSKQVQDRIADTNVIVDETLQGIQNVKAFSNEGFEVARYRTSVLKARDLALKGVKWRGVSSPSSSSACSAWWSSSSGAPYTCVRKACSTWATSPPSLVCPLRSELPSPAFRT